MKAAYFQEPGDPADVLKVGEFDDPEPGKGEVRVRVETAGVNPFDAKLLGAYHHFVADQERVFVLNDGAGVIDAVGEGIADTRIGERVWLRNAARPGHGAAAGLVVLASENAQPLPAHMSFEEGACLGVPLITAWYNLQFAHELEEKWVLITGGAGAVGHYLIQLAKLGGARVITTVSGKEKSAHAVRAGADHMINYRTEDVTGRVMEITGGEGVSLLCETNVNANAQIYGGVVAINGLICIYGSTGPRAELPMGPLIGRNARMQFTAIQWMTPGEERDCLAELNALLEGGKLIHTPARGFALDDIAGAYELVNAASAIGKVYVTP